MYVVLDIESLYTMYVCLVMSSVCICMYTYTGSSVYTTVVQIAEDYVIPDIPLFQHPQLWHHHVLSHRTDVIEIIMLMLHML